jgi:hypothetical protein
LGAEQLQNAIVLGQAINSDELIRLPSEARRIPGALRSKAGKRDSAEPVADLQAYIALTEADGPLKSPYAARSGPCRAADCIV